MQKYFYLIYVMIKDLKYVKMKLIYTLLSTNEWIL